MDVELTAIEREARGPTGVDEKFNT